MYTTDGSSPKNQGTLVVGSVRFVAYRSVQVRAIAHRLGAEESLEATGPLIIIIQPPLVPSSFLATVGMWRFSAQSALTADGIVSFADQSAILGNATLAFTASATWGESGVEGPRAEFSAAGLLIDPGTIQGVYVTADVGAALDGPLLSGKLPRDKLSIEVYFGDIECKHM